MASLAEVFHARALLAIDSAVIPTAARRAVCRRVLRIARRFHVNELALRALERELGLRPRPGKQGTDDSLDDAHGCDDWNDDYDNLNDDFSDHEQDLQQALLEQTLAHALRPPLTPVPAPSPVQGHLASRPSTRRANPTWGPPGTARRVGATAATRQPAREEWDSGAASR